MCGIVPVLLAVPVCVWADEAFAQALENGRLANEGFVRCKRYVEGWLEQADARTGLIPINLTKARDLWNAQDSAADNYPFMVLTCAIIDRGMFDGRMLEMLRTEEKLTSRVGPLPDTYSFSKQGFADDKPRISKVMFGSSEYIKDGLLPLTEWLGQSEWAQRMFAILDGMWERTTVDTKWGKIVSRNVEVNGESLQVLSRVYWMTGDEKYLECAIRLGDYYLLGEQHPTRNFKELRLRDHGCEVVSGLCELYATVHFARPAKKKEYEKPVHEMLDRILEVGRNADGLFYDWVNPKTGEHSEALTDTWGYNLNGFYTVYLIDKTESYRAATLKALNNIQKYRTYAWEGDSADGYADSIESAINLYNREPIVEAADWIDSEIKVMWGKQKANGIIEGWHGDGNFARTTIMYCLWKTQGVTVRPWREDVVFGAVREGETLEIAFLAQKDWKGKVIFDRPRHKEYMGLPIDWPRINQFPEWFTAEAGKRYVVRNMTGGTQKGYKGEELWEGVAISLSGGDVVRMWVE